MKQSSIKIPNHHGQLLKKNTAFWNLFVIIVIIIIELEAFCTSADLLLTYIEKNVIVSIILC